MRRVAFIAALGALLLSAGAHAEGTIPAAGPTGFMAWALSESSECDSRWMNMTEQKVPAAAPSLQERPQPPAIRADGPGAESIWPSLEKPTVKGTKLSHQIIDSRNFFHRVGGDFPFMQGLARKRNGPSRGMNPLQHPADAHLAVPYDVLRGLISPIQKKDFFHSIGEVSRPRLKSFGRLLGPGEHRLNTTPARPYYRAARPRLL